MQKTQRRSFLHLLKIVLAHTANLNVLDLPKLRDTKWCLWHHPFPIHSQQSLFGVLIKGNVRGQCTINMTLPMVLQRLDVEFDKLQVSGASSISKMIRKCASKAQEMHAAAPEEEAEDDDENEEEDDSDSGLAETTSEQSESSSDDKANLKASENDSEGEDQSVAGVQLLTFAINNNNNSALEQTFLTI